MDIKNVLYNFSGMHPTKIFTILEEKDNCNFSHITMKGVQKCIEIYA
jgi:hypothetical protein